MNKKIKILFPLVIGVSIALGIFLGTYLQRQNTQNTLRNIKFFRNDKISLILDLIDRNYVDSIDRNQIVESVLPELLNQLDPHSTYIAAKEMQGVNDEMRGNFSGIGVQFVMQNDTLMILEVISGGPSFKLGIQPGDRIIQVNERVIAGVNLPSDSIVGMLKGKKGTRVNVHIKRANMPDLLHFDIERGEIPIFSVDVAYMFSDSIGLIKVNKFAETTYREFKQGIDQLRKQGATKLIVDLRGNTGGYLQAVFQMVDEFLPENKMIVYTEGKSRSRYEYRSTRNASYIDLDVAVLIDEFSASASEIFAGAIQDNDRGIIVGRRSFGKGLVQEQIPFMDGSAVRLTVARFYTPSGRCIQKSYANGLEEYHHDLEERFRNEEFLHADSIHFNDSLKYSTTGGRTVYGGGGIMPDFFVPADTTGVNNLFRAAIQRNGLYNFSLNYSDKNRKILSVHKDVKSLVAALERQQVFNQFMNHIANQGIKYSPRELIEARDLIKMQLHAYISRNILGDQGLYPILLEKDKTVLKAVEELKKNRKPEGIAQLNRAN
jgi:carboxyl-terminal processing protease